MSAVKISEHVTYYEDKMNQQIGSDFFVIVAILPVICIARIICERVGSAIYLSSNAAKELSRKKGALNTATKKFEESFWKFIYYALAAIYGIVFISWEPVLRKPFIVYPNPITSKIYWYYMVQVSFYIWMSVCIFWDVRKRDFYQMATHHVVTLGLLVLSYTWQVVNVGSLIMILCDVADPFLELAKMLNYLKKETSSTIAFACFLVAFLGMRLFVYPVYAVYPATMYTFEMSQLLNAEIVYYAVNGMLYVLFGLNVFWSVLILKVLLRKLGGNDLKDNRSDDES